MAGVNGERGGRRGGAKKKRRKREGMSAIRTGLFTLRPPISLLSNFDNCQYLHQSKTGVRFYAWLTSRGNLLRLFTIQCELANWNFAAANTCRNKQKEGLYCRCPFPLSPVLLSPTPATHAKPTIEFYCILQTKTFS